ncbi:hypothetical protein [Thermodesulforhabdus norvegica]|uniref:Uncharacterized protein n=1 Tax=Thermodesulforhabdus norvegica TaxID=39841 RepID=A0A1I4UNK0_9BACT|nr:hypothetical protein [Thermodesulforhabdus norvegica]SFM90564.1 hypothetical protein SAMN05660836_01898 [Thermodesulforhabdus norvegica]
MKAQNKVPCGECSATRISEYQERHLRSQIAALDFYKTLNESDRLYLRWLTLPYVYFRHRLDVFTRNFFQDFCNRSCFQTGKSACCGFESIITFFADEVINILWGGPKAGELLIERLKGTNRPPFCVYLGDRGCLWTVRPLGCAMFFCDDAKKYVFGKCKKAEKEWEELKKQEKLFIWPTRPVLFDLIESLALERLKSPHMYFHFSPGLLRIKEKSRR